MRFKIQYILTITFLLINANYVFAQQGSASCSSAVKACVTTVNYSFDASYSGGSAGAGNNYGCLDTQPNPSWYYLDIAESGNIDIAIQSNTSGRDIDFAIWGPYSNIGTAQLACGSLPTPISCSYSPSGTELGQIPSAQAGDTYLFLLTNFSNTANNVSFTQTGGTGQTNCDGIPGINQYCAGAQKACLTQSGVNFPASTDAGSAPAGNNYGCLGSTPNPAWYYIKYNNVGTINMQMQGLGGGDIDFAVWGPYTTLNSAAAACGSLPAPVACSYSASATETASITNTAAGQIYLVLLTNYSNQVQDISFTQTGGSGVTDCVGTGVCVMQSITVTPTTGCRDNSGGTPTFNPGDDDYLADVTVTYINPPLVSGSTLSLGGAATGSVTLSAGFNETTYTFTGVSLPANGGTSTVSASFSADSDCTISTTVNNPASCSPPPCIITNDDCVDRVPMCPGVNPTCTPTGAGAVTDFTTDGGSMDDGCIAGENGSAWYTINIEQTGTLEFTINSPSTDMDFVMYGPFTGAPPCDATAGIPIRCDYAGTSGSGQTGLLGDGSASGFDAALSVTAGQNYVFVIDNFSQTGVGFTITWGGIASNTGAISCDVPVNCTTSSLAISAPTAVCSGASVPVTATCTGGGATIDYDIYTYQDASGNPAVAPTGYALFGDGVAAPYNHNFPLSSANSNLSYEGYVDVCGGTTNIAGFINNTCQPLSVTVFLAVYDGNLANEYDTPCSFVRQDITIYPAATLVTTDGDCVTAPKVELVVNSSVCDTKTGSVPVGGCGTAGTSSVSYANADAATFWGVSSTSLPACFSLSATANASCTLPVPTPTANSSATVTCTTTSSTLSVTGLTSGPTYTYNWSGGLGTGATATATSAGIYTVTVTNSSQGGCTATSSVTVAGNTTAPSVTASNDGPLTCTKTSVTLSPSAASGTITYAWSGGSTTVSSDGTYTVTATDSANGCTATSSTTVTSNTTAPTFTGVASCSGGANTGSVSQAATGGSGTYTYAISGGSFGATLANGSYTVTVTDTGTGCTSTGSVTVSCADICPTLTAQAPAAVISANSQCSTGCSLAGGVIVAPSTACPTGSTLEYSTDGGSNWSATVPTYDQTTAMSVMTRCNCNVDNTQSSPTNTVTTVPGTCTNPSFTGTASCSGGLNTGSISQTATGGVAPYTYAITGGSFGSTLANGTYTITVTDANDCATNTTRTVACTATPTASVNADLTDPCYCITSPVLDANNIVTTVGVLGDVMTITTTPATTGLTWNVTAGANTIITSGATAIDNGDGTYTANLTYTDNGTGWAASATESTSTFSAQNGTGGTSCTYTIGSFPDLNLAACAGATVSGATPAGGTYNPTTITAPAPGSPASTVALTYTYNAFPAVGVHPACPLTLNATANLPACPVGCAASTNMQWGN